MSTLAFWLAAATLLAFALLAADLLIGMARLRALTAYPPAEHPPRLSVVVAARDEQRHIEQALTSLLAQRYDDLELIVVNDRSGDDTGRIIDRLAATDPRLRPVHIDALPDGWLGKNHALSVGAERAGGELLLFTDADVVMAPDTLARAAEAIRRDRLDQISALPAVPMPGPWLEAFGGVFGMNFLLYLRPWKAADPRSRRYVGIGAFTMLKTSVYRAVGGHAPIAMRPDDDVKLGKLIKKNGYRQTLLRADELISVEWYASLGEMIDGLRKNAFAGLGYSVWLVALVVCGQLALYVWPYLALALCDGVTWWLNLAIVLLLSAVMALSGRRWATRWRAALSVPASALVLVYIVCRATYLTLRDGGIYWRDTFYSLKELRANRV